MILKSRNSVAQIRVFISTTITLSLEFWVAREFVGLFTLLFCSFLFFAAIKFFCQLNKGLKEATPTVISNFVLLFVEQDAFVVNQGHLEAKTEFVPEAIQYSKPYKVMNYCRELLTSTLHGKECPGQRTPHILEVLVLTSDIPVDTSFHTIFTVFAFNFSTTHFTLARLYL